VNAVKFVLGLFVFLFASVASCLATAPTEITTLVSDATTVWDSVKVLIIAVAAFLIMLRMARKVTRAG